MYSRQIEAEDPKRKEITSGKTAFTEQLDQQRNGAEDYDNAQETGL